MDFVHDLTADGDFSARQSFNLPRFLRNLENTRDDDGANHDNIQNELVLTGDAQMRQTKRFCIDYEQDGNICDCCGRDINRKPWDFKKTTKLCDDCEKFLEMMHDKDFMDNVDLVVGEDSSGFITRRPKPWDLSHDDVDRAIERQATNNVLLWD